MAREHPIQRQYQATCMQVMLIGSWHRVCCLTWVHDYPWNEATVVCISRQHPFNPSIIQPIHLRLLVRDPYHLFTLL